MLQGVGEDGENMRNLLFSVFSRFSLLLPFLSPTPEEINPHSFRFSMQTWEEIPTVSVLLAGTGGESRARSMGSLTSHTLWVCVRDAPAEPGWGTTGTHLIFVQPCPIPSTLLLMICQFHHHYKSCGNACTFSHWLETPCVAKALEWPCARHRACALQPLHSKGWLPFVTHSDKRCSMWPSPSSRGSHPCCSHHMLPSSKLIEIISAPQPRRINKAGSVTLIYQ